MAMAMGTGMATARRRRTSRRASPSPVAVLKGMDRQALMWRAAIAVGTLVLAYAAFASALGGVAKVSHPAVALSFDKGQPTALAVLADEALLRTDNSAAPKLAEVRARRALRSLALSPAALRILGLTDSGMAGTDRSLALMNLSTRVSRRDFGAQVWWIEHRVAQGNVTKALEHYDVAMRTNASARTLLIPVLFKALENPEIQNRVARYFYAGNPWALDFIAYSTDKGRDPTNIVEPILNSDDFIKSSEFKHLVHLIMEGLISAGNAVDTQRVYLSLPGSDPSILLSAGFSEAAMREEYIPVAWDLSAYSTAGAVFERSSGKGFGALSLRAFVGEGDYGIVARKLMFLRPGRYAFSTVAETVTAAPQQAARWQVSCIAKGQRQIIWQADALPVKKALQFNDLEISPNCQAQSLELELQAGDGVSGLEMIVHSLQFKQL